MRGFLVLEGARMLLVLFVPLAVLVGAETLGSVITSKHHKWSEKVLALRQDGFTKYFGLSFLACLQMILPNNWLLIH